MPSKKRFKFKATVSDRGQIFIPKIVQNYFGIKNRDKVVFEVQDDGNILFKKKRRENNDWKILFSPGKSESEKKNKKKY